MGGSSQSGKLDFLISYVTPDEKWAEWVAWTLEESGWNVLVKVWDAIPGSSWVSLIHETMRDGIRVIPILSGHYVNSSSVQAEWQVAWLRDPRGTQRGIIPVQVATYDTRLAGILASITPISLTEVNATDNESLQKELLKGIRLATAGRQGRPGIDRPGTPIQPERSSGVSARIWNVPWPRNPNFTGRTVEIRALERQLTSTSSAVIAPQAVYGMSGVGKTQLALEYVYRNTSRYDLIWWVPAEEETLVIASFQRLAKKLSVGVEGNATDSVSAVVEALRRGVPFSRWLVVLDNASSPFNDHGLLSAASDDGHVVITTRDPNWSGATHPVWIDTLKRRSSIRLLRKRAPDIAVRDAEDLAEALGNLPLALAQAAAWLTESGMPVQTYLECLRQEGREILSRGRVESYALNVASAWQIAMRRLEEVCSPASELLKILSFLGPDLIPVELLFGSPAHYLISTAHRLSDSRITRYDALSWIGRFGLARISSGSATMHRLVQTVIRDELADETRENYRRSAHCLLASADPDDPNNPSSWRSYEALLPHALASGAHDARDDAARELVVNLTWYLNNRGDLTGSRTMAQNALDRWSETLGHGHANTLDVASNLAGTVLAGGDLTRAISLYRYVKESAKESHQELRLLHAEGNEAFVLRSMGRYKDALAIFQDVVPRYREIQGIDHPLTIVAHANLAHTLRLSGELTAAQDQFRAVLTANRRILGEDHPWTLSARGHIAIITKQLGDFDAALSMQREIYSKHVDVLGVDHPRTLSAAANLAESLLEADVAAACELLEDTVARRVIVLGPDHPETWKTHSLLAEVYRMEGRLLEADTLLGHTLKHQRESLGELHPDTLSTKFFQALLRRDAGDPGAALCLAEVAAERATVLGQEHPETIIAKSACAVPPP